MPVKRDENTREAIRLAESLVKLTVGEDQRIARELRNRLRTPMIEVLAQVPGTSIKAKSDAIGICRQTYYTWARNETRPTERQANKLEELTGIAADRIMGQRR